MKEHIEAKHIERFWDRVAKAGPEECWEWTGTKNIKGYGYLYMIGEKRNRFASHLALILSGVDRPQKPNDHALHGDCSNPGCVNPSHLRWGSNSENAADRVRLNRVARLPGSKHPRAKLTEADVTAIRKDGRKYRDIAKDYGVSFGLIGHVKARRAWQHLA